MKNETIDLNNTPILTNNICKYIVLDAFTKEELNRKIKEYERLLVKALTNKYRLVNLSFDNDNHYQTLSNGKYQTSILLNFTGIQKNEISSPEETLRIVKRLQALESKNQSATHIISHDKHNPEHIAKRGCHTEEIPIDVLPNTDINNKVSSIQNQILEKLISHVNVRKIGFLVHRKPQARMEITYEYVEELNNDNKNHESEDR